MLDFLKRRLKSEKGAMDKVLVTLLFVVIGVGAVATLSTWVNAEKDKVTATATTKISEVNK